MCVQLAQQDAEKHAGLVKSLSKEIGDLEAPDMPSLVETVRNTSARLGVIMTDEAAVLAQFPTWPQVPPHYSCASGMQATCAGLSWLLSARVLLPVLAAANAVVCMHCRGSGVPCGTLQMPSASLASLRDARSSGFCRG